MHDPGLRLDRPHLPLHKRNISWRYYHGATTPEIWNPLVDFQTVHQNGQLANVQDVSQFYNAAKAGTLPAVSWIAPNPGSGDHPTSLVSAGQSYVTGVVNAAMQSPNWTSSAIFLIRKSTVRRQAAAPGAASRSRVQAVDGAGVRRRAAG